jgi:thiol:disulfide interchange protein DsbA
MKLAHLSTLNSTLALLCLALTACSHAPSGDEIAAPSTAAASSPNSPAPDAGNASAPAAAASGSPGPAANGSGPVTPNDLTAAAKTEQEGSDSGTTDSSEASLEHTDPLPAQAQLPAGHWIAGSHYTVLSPAQPVDEPRGKVQVLEVFWYGCPHCYALDPYLQSWNKTKADYIDFVRVPIMWGDVHRAHAQLFYTLQALGKEDALHSQVFDEIQQRHDELFVQSDAQGTLAAQLKFAAASGISANDFTNAYNSFGVQTNLQKADDLDRRYKIDGVPTIVIDGKYESDVGRAGGEQQLIQLINDLAASEKRLIG